ncbi:MAG: hypothetical protein WEC75_00350 [Dehalococcoidia bacterium]
MNAEEFMRDHAMKASSGRIPEILGDLTPQAMAQLPGVMAGGPNPPTGFEVQPIRAEGESFIFDVTYTGDGDARVTMRETVQQQDGTWKIVHLEKPA